MVRIADSGAATIRALLEESSSTLSRAEAALNQGLQSAQGLQGEVPTSTYTAIEKMVTFYSGLKRRIEGIQTSEGQGKRLAVSGVGIMVGGLTQLRSGIEGGATTQAQEELGQAVVKLELAAGEMERAVERL
jgi:hypothetical protein